MHNHHKTLLPPSASIVITQQTFELFMDVNEEWDAVLAQDKEEEIRRLSVSLRFA